MMERKDKPVSPASSDIGMFLGFFIFIGVIELYANVGFVWFALIGFIFTYFFTHLHNVLDRDKVDIWYYSLALMGLIAFFSANRVSEDLFVNRLHAGEIRERLSSLRLLESDPVDYFNKEDVSKPILEQIRRAFVSEAEHLERPDHDCQGEQSQNHFYCKERILLRSIAIRFSAIEDGISFTRRVPTKGEIEKLIGDEVVFLFPPEEMLFYREIGLSASDMFWFYAPAYRTRKIESEEARISRKLEQQTEIADALRPSISALVSNEESELSELEDEYLRLNGYNRIGYGEVLSRNFWPYIICVALLMKLARYRIKLFDHDRIFYALSGIKRGIFSLKTKITIIFHRLIKKG
jgi:hypothetical protein